MNLSAKILVISEFGLTSAAGETLRQCLARGPRIIAFFGKDCRALEDLCDSLADAAGVFVVTTSHPNEQLDDAVAVLTFFDHEELGREFETITV